MGKVQMSSTPDDFGGQNAPPPQTGMKTLSCRNFCLGERR